MNKAQIVKRFYEVVESEKNTSQVLFRLAEEKEIRSGALTIYLPTNWAGYNQMMDCVGRMNKGKAVKKSELQVAMAKFEADRNETEWWIKIGRFI